MKTARSTVNKTRPLEHGSWRRAGAKIACAGACALMAGQLLLPSVALAAEWVNIGGTQYDTAASGVGWAWDGGDSLDLNDYSSDGNGIYAQGDLVINVAGNNHVWTSGAGATLDRFDGTIGVKGGDLTIQGDGSLAVEGGTNVVNAVAEGPDDYQGVGGSVSIDGTRVDITATDKDDQAIGMSASGGDIAIRNGADVKIVAGLDRDGQIGEESPRYDAAGIYASDRMLRGEASGINNAGGNITIEGENTKVSVASGSKGYAKGIFSICAEGHDRATVIAIKGGAFVAVDVATDASWIARPNVYGIAAQVGAGGNSAVSRILIDGKATSVSAIARITGSAQAESVEGYGMMTTSYGEADGGGITINKGSVRAQGVTGAMLAWNGTMGDGAGATISLGEGAAIAPDGVVVREFWEELGRPMSSDFDSTAFGYKGQTFGNQGEGALGWRSEDMAKDVTITFVEEEDPVLPPATDGGGATLAPAVAKSEPAAARKVVTVAESLLARTGDETLTTVVAFGVAGVAGLLTAAFVTRCRD